MPKQFKFMIGADPEFNIMLQNKKASAETVMKNILKGEKDGNMGFEIGKFGVIGWDGCPTTGEIRPQPETCPEKLVKNIEELFKAFAKKCKIFNFSTLSDAGSVGGHIHFDIPKSYGLAQMKRAHQIMSSYYIAIMAGENKINLKTRIKENYGNIKDYKSEDKGNNVEVYEFRVPSAEWMTTPKIAMGTLAFLGTVWNEIINNDRNIRKYNDIIWKNDKQGDALQILAISNFSNLTIEIVKRIKKAVKTFETYKDFKNEIEYILQPNKVLKDKEKVNYEILTGWNLQKQNHPNKRQIMKNITAKNMKEQGEEIMENIAIDYNPDTNVGDFVRELKKRIVTLNWKLKYNYAFFGIRKGIKDYIVIKGNEIIKGLKQCKTIKDKQTIQEIAETVEYKFKSKGKLHGKKENNVIIGIPFKERLDGNHKGFIETIYEIEKERLTIEKEGKLIDDTNEKFEKTGKIFQAANKDEELHNMLIPEENMRHMIERREMVEMEEERENQEYKEINENERIINVRTPLEDEEEHEYNEECNCDYCTTIRESRDEDNEDEEE